MLFDTNRLKQDFEKIFRQKGIDLQAALRKRLHINYVGHPFSLGVFLKILKEGGGHSISDSLVRKKHRQALLQNKYLDPQADRTLHFLRKKGYLLMILSFGTPSYQYLKIKMGCGKKFMRHFIRVKVTRGPKFLFIKELHRKFPRLPIFFIDDTRDHIILVKKHVPFVKTIHFTSSHTLSKVAKRIIAYAQK